MPGSLFAFTLHFVSIRKQSVLGVMPAIKTLAQKSGLWDKLRVLRSLDSRTRWGTGFGPDAIVAPLL